MTTRERNQPARVADGKTKWTLVIPNALLDAVEDAAESGPWSSTSEYVRHTLYNALPAPVRARLDKQQAKQ